MKRSWLLIPIAIGIVIYYFADPTQGLLPKCPFYFITGLYCPGCGSQRAIHALLHGDGGMAMAYNPLFVLAVFFLLAEGVFALLKFLGYQVRSLSVRRHTPFIVLVIVLCFWVLRNLTFAPFSWLAPG